MGKCVEAANCGGRPSLPPGNLLLCGMPPFMCFLMFFFFVVVVVFGFCVILWKFLRGFGTIDWPPNSVESQRFQGFVYLRPTGGATRWCEENIENY